MKDIEIKTRLFCAYTGNSIWWFRIFGYGLMWKNFKSRPLLFSQRNGYRRSLKLGNWYFELLPKLDITLKSKEDSEIISRYINESVTNKRRWKS